MIFAHNEGLVTKYAYCTIKWFDVHKNGAWVSIAMVSMTPFVDIV
jgi:hypothetical protein